MPTCIRHLREGERNLAQRLSIKMLMTQLWSLDLFPLNIETDRNAGFIFSRFGFWAHSILFPISFDVLPLKWKMRERERERERERGAAEFHRSRLPWGNPKLLSSLSGQKSAIENILTCTSTSCTTRSRAVRITHRLCLSFLESTSEHNTLFFSHFTTSSFRESTGEQTGQSP